MIKTRSTTEKVSSPETSKFSILQSEERKRNEERNKLDWQVDTNEPFTPKGETFTTMIFFVKANTIDEALRLGREELGDADIAIVGVSLIEQ
jgi:hypothetical protein